jgi:hypothetical protein
MGIVDTFLYLITRWEFVAVTAGLLFMLPVVFSIASMDKKSSRPSAARRPVGGRVTGSPEPTAGSMDDDDSADSDDDVGFDEED